MRARTVVLVSFPVVFAFAASACGSSDPAADDGTGTQSDAATQADSTAAPDTSSPAKDAGNIVDSGSPDSAKDSGSDAGLPVVVSTVKAGATVDYTGQEFGGPSPDGTQDATVTAVIDGAFDALVWVSVEADGGGSAASNEWDTVVGTEALPDLGTPFTLGSETWTTAVADGATVLNDGTGHVLVGPGLHALTVSCASTPAMAAGQNFRLYVRQGTTWFAGPLFVW